jgi:hypothetical protein
VLHQENALARTLAPPITTSTSTPDLATSLTFHAAHSGVRSSLCRQTPPPLVAHLPGAVLAPKPARILSPIASHLTLYSTSSYRCASDDTVSSLPSLLLSAPRERTANASRMPIALQRPRPATCKLFAARRPSRPYAHAGNRQRTFGISALLPASPKRPSLSNSLAPPLVSSLPCIGPRVLTLTQIPPSPLVGILLRPRRRLRRHHHRTAAVAGLDPAAASPAVATGASSSALPAAPASPAQHQHQCQHSISTSDNAALATATAPAAPAQYQ